VVWHRGKKASGPIESFTAATWSGLARTPHPQTIEKSTDPE